MAEKKLPTKLRLKRFRFSLDVFEDMYRTGNTFDVVVEQGWPEDAKIVAVQSDELTHSFTVMVQSKEFAFVKIGVPLNSIPEGEIKLGHPDRPAPPDNHKRFIITKGA